MQKTHVATVAGTPLHDSALGRLCYHLAELQKDGHIHLKAKLMPGPAHPESVKAADFSDESLLGVKLKKPMHAVVDVFLLEKAVLGNGQELDQLAGHKRGRGKQGKASNTWLANAHHIAPVLNWMLLTDTAGLQVGPDSDGLLNFCDRASSVSQPHAQTELLQEAVEGRTHRLAPTQSVRETSQGPSQVLSEGQAAQAPVTVQQMLDSVALPDQASAAVAPAALRTVPKHFQLQGLHWMLARERQGDALGRSASPPVDESSISCLVLLTSCLLLPTSAFGTTCYQCSFMSSDANKHTIPCLLCFVTACSMVSRVYSLCSFAYSWAYICSRTACTVTF